ncbi:ARPP-1 family domain-containing protein [Pseudarthrobacter sp. S6]|uniref:ARPP-1 family domain-containing protein n=1 Tax=Pseudarthrobacter sp. S6 TaxID=3418420 RepID=UPI003CE9EA1D
MKVQQLHVGAGATVGPLSIFPVWTAAPGELGISTGTHADVAVSELASGAQVPRLTVTNNGPRPALLLEGELLEGGQQHRTCARDVLLGAGETRDIDTYCVEAGRWEAGQSSHRRQARRAPLNVWAELAAGSDDPRGSDRQGRIWNRVSRFDAVRGPSVTSSLLDHLDRFTQDRDDPFTASDAPAPLDGQRGVVIGLGSQPLLLEVFGTHTLFRRHYRQLIESALLDVELLPPKIRASRSMPAQLARDFAAAVQATDFGTFDGGLPELEVRHHRGGLRSRNVSRTAGPITAAGIAVELPHRKPELAHLTGWNTRHTLMEIA